MTKDGKPIKIGFLVKQPEEKWFQDEHKFAKKCAADNGFEVLCNGTKDSAKILELIDNLATNGAQGFVICTPDTKLGPAIVNKAKDLNLKVFAVDDQFIGPDGKFMEDVPYMGISAGDIGEMVGKSLAEEFKKRGWKAEETAAAGITFEELATSKARTDGAQKALVAGGFPKDRIFTKNEKTTDIPGAMDAMQALLTQHPEIKHWLVFSMNDEGVLGAVRALEGRTFAPETCVGIGIGGSSCFPELEREKPTSFIGTALISPKRHGYETTEMMLKWIRDGVEPAKKTLTKAIMVDRSNFKKIAKEEGILD
ncbi:MAG: substrate-binding domain-containing protein [Armatimonadetes bacterium]|nr:substrate-binding domain-containing protein [Armatimonadota bacterium]